MSAYRIALDVMGGDFAPEATLAGALKALQAWPDLHLTLVGPEDLLRKKCESKEWTSELLARTTRVHAPSVVEFQDPPTIILKEKKDSSIRVAAQLVREGVCDGLVSLGHTGAAMVASTLVIGKLDGIDRPGLASPMPSPKATPTLLIEVGASIDSRPEHLACFGLMGSIYAEQVFGISQPSVAVMSIGEEENKGTEVTLKAAELLRQSSLNFRGNAEGRDLWNGKFDVIVCDGYVGNALLKSAEGTAKLLKKGIKEALTIHWLARLAALMIRKPLQTFFKKLDYKEFGGLPLLGIKGVSIIGHGSSDARAVKNAIRAAMTNLKHELPRRIAEGLTKMGSA
ncbi:MAG: phosphate acyltransferase PlsX [Holophagaceae bacterium]